MPRHSKFCAGMEDAHLAHLPIAVTGSEQLPIRANDRGVLMQSQRETVDEVSRRKCLGCNGEGTQETLLSWQDSEVSCISA